MRSRRGVSRWAILDEAMARIERAGANRISVRAVAAAVCDGGGPRSGNGTILALQHQFGSFSHRFRQFLFFQRLEDTPPEHRFSHNPWRR